MRICAAAILNEEGRKLWEMAQEGRFDLLFAAELVVGANAIDARGDVIGPHLRGAAITPGPVWGFSKQDALVHWALGAELLSDRYIDWFRSHGSLTVVGTLLREFSGDGFEIDRTLMEAVLRNWDWPGGEFFIPLRLGLGDINAGIMASAWMETEKDGEVSVMINEAEPPQL